jgi:sterol desaturase/sphingolipid hydroxylase (fatty acid hydroxylase superfamily)
VHHTDLDMDVSTASRFHIGEMLFSTAFLSIAVAVFAVAPLMLVSFFIAFEAATLFHHSNWRLPLWFERILNRVMVTPRMHGIHHSIVQRETNSNWGTIFCWWDKFHRTLRRDIPQNEITIGVAAYRDERELTVGQLLILPFADNVRGGCRPVSTLIAHRDAARIWQHRFIARASRTP